MDYRKPINKICVYKNKTKGKERKLNCKRRSRTTYQPSDKEIFFSLDVLASKSNNINVRCSSEKCLHTSELAACKK